MKYFQFNVCDSSKKTEMMALQKYFLVTCGLQHAGEQFESSHAADRIISAR